MSEAPAERRRAVAGGGDLRGALSALRGEDAVRGPHPLRAQAAAPAASISPRYNVGDGPAAFLILIVGAIVAVGAILLDQGRARHGGCIIIWLPIGAGLTIYGLQDRQGGADLPGA